MLNNDKFTKTRVVKQETMANHQHIEQLLPWYVTGQLSPDDRHLVEAHAADCEDCRAEIAEEMALAEALQTLPPPPALAQLRPAESILAQIGAEKPHLRTSASWVRPQRGWPQRLQQRLRQGFTSLGPNRRTVAGVMAAQAAAICFLIAVPIGQNGGSNPLTDPNSAAYRGLSGGPVGASGNGLAVFDPLATERDIRRALKGVDASIVDGPTDGDAYLLHLPEDSREAALAKLRANPAVDLAEAVDPEEPR
jgi:hypothetical protein